MMETPILQVQHLGVRFDEVVAVNNISFDLQRKSTCAIVGESGSGKSVTALSILGLLPKTASIEGQIYFQQKELLKSSPYELRKVRGSGIAMIFQEPMTSLNPVFTVGEQIQETIHAHQTISTKASKQKTVTALQEVGIQADRFSAYPHELSGGMRQRIMIAIALVCKPQLLIADEPTTALDATTSIQIMELLITLKEKRGMSLLLISHDLDLVARVSDQVLVMKDGNLVETGDASEVLSAAKHPYTKALLACKPSIHKKLRRLPTIADTLQR